MVDGRSATTDVNGQDASHSRQSKRPRGTSPTNGTDSTPAKRSRVSRACDQCRASREKCDGQKPVCHTCDSQKRSCTYDEPPKKRGIQPNYIRTLELTLAWLFQSVPETQAALSRNLPVVNGAAQRYVFTLDIELIEASAATAVTPRLHKFPASGFEGDRTDLIFSCALKAFISDLFLD